MTAGAVVFATPAHAAGRDAPRCGAKKRQGEGTCTQVAGWGTNHVGVGLCKLHGGKTPTHVQNAVEVQARKQLAQMDVTPVSDPLTELGRIAGQVVAWKDAMAEKVNQLTSIRYDAGESGEQLRAEVALLERAFDRCERFLTAMARLDIDERLARVTIAQKLMVLRAVEAALASAGVAGPAAVEAKKIAARHLRAIG